MTATFGDDEIAWFEMMGALETDESGATVLIGLTEAETERYLQLARTFPPLRRTIENEAERAEYLRLYNRHEIARLRKTGAIGRVRRRVRN